MFRHIQRVLPATRALISTPGTIGTSRMSSHVTFKPDTEVAFEQRSRISDIPVPAGSWQEHYDKRTRKWNIHLLLSTIIFVGTIITCVKTNVFLFHDIGDVRKYKIDPR